MFERQYRLVRSTANCHLYEWVNCPVPDAKNWLKNTYFTKEELGGDDPPDEIVVRGEAV